MEEVYFITFPKNFVLKGSEELPNHSYVSLPN
jgi:hypothetical protein